MRAVNRRQSLCTGLHVYIHDRRGGGGGGGDGVGDDDPTPAARPVNPEQSFLTGLQVSPRRL